MNRKLLVGIAVAGAALALYLAVGPFAGGDKESAEGGKEPLYWVAPMDPDYRRDKPGKSPMGMDLVPVYDEGAASPGTVTISPDVVNNLGVRTGRVERRPMTTVIDTVGYVRYDEDRLSHIHPRVAGWIEELHVKAAGDPVAAGEPLYALYSPELVNAQEELVLALSRGNQRLVQAAEERLRALQIDRAIIDRLRESRQIRQTLTFHAPRSGVVDNLNVREGFYVQPGTLIMSVGSLDHVWVEAEVFERQAALVQAGQPVTMTLDYLPGRQWQGRVDYVYPTLDPETRTARLRLRFANPDGVLKPNMFAQVEIRANPDADALVIPREALIRTGKQDRVVLALGDGHFKSVEVAVGRIDHGQVEIISGLEEGERIVTSAQFLLDSESSKTSDFRRLHHGDDVADAVWVAGEIKSAMPAQRRITVAHEPVPAWEWPAMIMDLAVAEGVEMATLTPGTRFHMEITREDEETFVITGTHIMGTDGAIDGAMDGAMDGLMDAMNANDPEDPGLGAESGGPAQGDGAPQGDRRHSGKPETQTQPVEATDSSAVEYRDD